MLARGLARQHHRFRGIARLTPSRVAAVWHLCPFFDGGILLLCCRHHYLPNDLTIDEAKAPDGMNSSELGTTFFNVGKLAYAGSDRDTSKARFVSGSYSGCERHELSYIRPLSGYV